MKTKCVNWMKAVLMIAMLSWVPACSDEPMGKGDVEFEITDAPTDDASVEAVMVTVSDILIDGKVVSGFAKQTINLKAYQEGNTKLLVKASELDARTYHSITLVLDLNEDVDGNAPGCYVLTTGGAKYQLRSSAGGKMNVVLAENWNVRSNTTTKIVMDFDLRKAIAYAEDAEVKYRFVSDDNLQAAVRVIVKERSGNIEGTVSIDENIEAEKMIVYAYKKGTFNASAETQANAEGVMFAKAVTSAEVKQGLVESTYTLALLEEGEYELHFATYSEANGKFQFNTMLASETSGSGAVGDVIKITAGAELSLASQVALNF